ncbi:phosphoglycerate mutase-like protein 1 [Dendrobium catenatum]|uniref:phosphoglycerate mutase-like protein 1 n=1 Tax=Dendrobium catenatum TaxID=906689 RepID=UPI0010A07211|nr:phosphoglycerate mutase-like protein 1 [Dendrobium catenatum]
MLNIPFIMGVHPCDRRRTIREYQTLFPAVDFSLIESNEDTLWEPNVREPNEEVAIRGMKFINWLLTRRETEIAVITHSGFLYHTLNKFGKDFHPLIKDEICKHFGNCELRSMVIVDKSLLGFGTDRTNFPGRIPRGLDLPSDIAHDKHPNATGDH